MEKRNKGFTLAEVLISITVIGVISAVTVPVLMQNTNKQEYVTALKKAYSTFSQAANQIIAEEGSPAGDDGWADSNEHVYTLFKNHLNVLKDCAAGTGCFEQLGTTRNKGYKHLTSGYTSDNFNTKNSEKIILTDGVQVSFSNAAGCTENSVCAVIWIDVNGEKKPNQFGRDVFYLELRHNGISPACSSAANCTRNSGGQGCACKILREDAMNY